MITKEQDPEWLNDRIGEALELAAQGINTDGAHHKQWYLDQIVRALFGDEQKYQAFVRKSQAGEDGPFTYGWDEGIAP